MLARSSLHLDRANVALVLGGGNALGSYLAGAYEQLHAESVEPSWIVGASIGAITGAILAGNAPERRLERLNEFWSESELHTSLWPFGKGKSRQVYNGLHSAFAAVLTRPTIFSRRYPGLWSVLPWVPNDVAIYNHRPLKRTLERFVDFDRLNRAEVRFSAGCVDLETGDEVFFDNTRQEIRPEHIMASAAISPAFPPVEIEGRLLCDPGYTNNLPLDFVLAEVPQRDLVCIAVELFSLRAPRPKSLDATLERAHDLVFASASRRTVKALEREYALHEALQPDGPSVSLVHLAYQAASHELSAKTFDYSPSSIRDRWAAGKRDMVDGLALLRERSVEKRRFCYLPVEPGRAAAAAEAGAEGSRPNLARVA